MHDLPKVVKIGKPFLPLLIVDSASSMRDKILIDKKHGGRKVHLRTRVILLNVGMKIFSYI